MEPQDCYSASHPSDHNSVSMHSRVRKQRREVWKLKWQRRRNRDGQKIKNSKGKMQTRELEEIHPRPLGQDHDTAVVAPLPLMQGYGYPYESSEDHGLCLGVSTCSPVNLEYLTLRVDPNNLRISLGVVGARVHWAAHQWVECSGGGCNGGHCWASEGGCGDGCGGGQLRRRTSRCRGRKRPNPDFSYSRVRVRRTLPTSWYRWRPRILLFTAGQRAGNKSGEVRGDRRKIVYIHAILGSSQLMETQAERYGRRGLRLFGGARRAMVTYTFYITCS